MFDYLAAILAVFLALAAVLFTLKSASSRTLRVRACRLMTARERQIIPLIEDAVPHCRVHAQVAMGALVKPRKGLDRKRHTAVRNRYSQKIVDCVLEDRSSGEVLALVELDDRTHNAAKDRRRDEITRVAGYRTIRLPAGKRVDKESVRSQILSGLGSSCRTR